MELDWEAVGAIGEIVGAVGVLATLIYLAAQIRDNTRSLQAASLQSVLDGPRDRYFLPMAGRPGRTGAPSFIDLIPLFRRQEERT
jgi:hypothetical protein